MALDLPLDAVPSTARDAEHVPTRPAPSSIQSMSPPVTAVVSPSVGEAVSAAINAKNADANARSTRTSAAPVSAALMHAIRTREQQARQASSLASASASASPLGRLEGAFALHCRVDLSSRRVSECAAMASLFKGYESLLPGRDLRQVGLVSATAAGLCGGVHATASALALEMALDLRPPPLGIVLRNLLLSCQYLNDNGLHLFVIAGPAYAYSRIAATNPQIAQQADHRACRHAARHGYLRVSHLLQALEKDQGALVIEAQQMSALARRAYTALGGKYPHSESIVPGGVQLHADAATLAQFQALLQPLLAYADKVAAVWDDVFDFLLDVEPRYAELGRSAAHLLDFGQWDHPEHYSARYRDCDHWGAQRWSTPGAIIGGALQTTDLSRLNAGLEEHLDYSHQQRQALTAPDFSHDPNGRALSPLHPWNKHRQDRRSDNPQAYSWGSSLTWEGHGFEVGAYARLYLSAAAQRLPSSSRLSADGRSLAFELPQGTLRWSIPAIWNSFERNRARAYSLAFSLCVIQDNLALASRLIASGETATQQPLNRIADGTQLGVGLWGASRGFLAHWLVLREQRIDNYQIAIPSRINVGTRQADGRLGPLEQALCNTPIIEDQFHDAASFTGIDLQRTIQSFDPCLSSLAVLLLEPAGVTIERAIET